MNLRVEEIRARAERFEVLRREEWHRVGAGLKSRPALGQLYQEHELLGDPDLFAGVERRLAGASGEETERMRLLLKWLAEFRVALTTSPLLDEYFAWEAGTTLEVGSRELSLRQIPREIVRTRDRRERRTLATRRDRALEEAVPLWLDLVEREREAVRAMGYGEYLQARDRLTGVDHEGVLREGRDVVRATESLFVSRLDEVLAAAEIPAGEAVQSDQWHLRRMPGLEEVFSPARVRRLVARDLRAAGVIPDGAGRLTLDLEARPLKRPGSFCVGLEVPRRIVGVVSCTGGWLDAARTLEVTGTGLACAHVDPRLGFERRMLGDPAVGEAHAALMRGQLYRRWWTRRLDGLRGESLERALTRGAWFDLQEFRRDVARLAFQVEMWQAPDPAESISSYGDRLHEATGFRPASQSVVSALEEGLAPASRIRGRMLAASLRARLGSLYGTDWARHPSVGPFLTDLWAGGWRTARRGARKAGRSRVVGDDLTEWYRGRLA